MADRIDPTWARWGAELRRLRDLAGVTQINLASRMNVSSPLISGFERGTRTPKRDHALDLDRELSTSGELERLWVDLKDTRELPHSWRDFVLLEQQATEIREYQMALVPGLLQTDDYARATLRNGRSWDSDEQVEHLVEARTSRLGELTTRPALSFVLDEVAVRRVLGSREAMQNQIEHLLALINARRIRVSLIPEYAPQHPGLSGSLRIMNLGDGRLVGHAEHWGGEVVISDSTEVNKLVTLFGNLQAEALSPSASAELIDKTKRGIT